MPSLLRTFLAATALSLTAAPVALTPAMAQPAEEQGAQPRQTITLTQKLIDGLLAAQPQLADVQKKMTSEQPDPKIEAAMSAIAKKNGFASLDEYGAAADSVGAVLDGVDPETKTFVGPSALLKKQMAQLQADKSTPAKDKAEALKQMKEALANAGSSPTPPPGNVDLVVKNYDKLAAAFQNND